MRVVDLFAGCGGLSLGFQNAEMHMIAAFEYWDEAIEVYRQNLRHPVIKLDLSDVEKAVQRINPLKPDIIIGGPPCQDFSHAGKRNEGKRANLTICFADIVCSIKPQWFLMENVARASSSLAFKKAKAMFLKAGYGLTVSILDASRCGVPQKRKRLVCIGKLGEAQGFLDQGIDKRLAKKPLTVREYMKDELDIEHYYRHPRNYSRRAVYSVDEPAATIRGVNRPIPSGYTQHPGDSVSPDGARPLSTAERARIQTFPAKFKWLGTKTAKEQMIGNAVPVKLAEFVAKSISDYHSGEICSCKSLRLPLRSPGDYPHNGLSEVRSMAQAIGKTV